MTPESKNEFFRFREFQVRQSSTPAKITTDAVLLGTWVQPKTAENCLDVGCGTGVLALILAQRFSDLNIDAIDIDGGAFRDAHYNFAQSPWKKRLHVFHARFQEFTPGYGEKYDYLISNPPFFMADLLSPIKKKNLFRHQIALKTEELFFHSQRLLNQDGCLGIIFPFRYQELLLKTAANYQLFPFRKTIVFPKRGKNPHRVLVELNFHPLSITEINEIILRDDFGPSPDYQNLTHDFFLPTAD